MGQETKSATVQLMVTPSERDKIAAVASVKGVSMSGLFRPSVEEVLEEYKQLRQALVGS